MKNSFALDNDGNLYTWGSWQTGLLANIAEADIARPNLVEIYDASDKYAAHKISCSHFHAAVVADRAQSSKPRELKYAIQLIDEIKLWYNEVFIRSITNPLSFLKFILKKNETTRDLIKYEEFEKLFLQPFFAYQRLNSKDIFKMNKVYQELLYEEFGLMSKKTSFDPNELLKIAESNNQYIKEAYEFAKLCVEHFKKNPEDFPFFLRLVMHFEPYIRQSDLINLFEYAYSSESKIAIGNMDSEKQKIVQIFNDMKRIVKLPGENGKSEEEFMVDTNDLIDTILKIPTGFGVVFTWGVSSESRLGYKIENTNKSEENEEAFYQRIPRKVYFKNVFTKISKVACGYSHTLALSDDHRVYSWGSAKYGCLGNSRTDNQVMPDLIEKDLEKKLFVDIIDIAAGMYYSMAMDHNGHIFTWGCGSGGRLGHGNENSVGYPKLVRYFQENDIKVSLITCGDTHSAALSTSKELYTWGSGNFGKLGHGNYEDIMIPQLVEMFSNKKIDQIVCGSHNSMAILTDHRIYSWGKNSHGMLGVPQQVEKNILVPTEVSIQKEDSEVVVSEIAIGSMHTMFLCSNGSLFSCGNSVNGILAHPDIFDKLTFPKKIPDSKFYETERRDILVDSALFKKYNTDFTLNINKNKYATALVYGALSPLNSAFITNNGELYMCGEGSLICEESETLTTNADEGTGGTPNNNASAPVKKNVIEEKEFGPKWQDKVVKINIQCLSGKVSYVAISTNHIICVAEKRAYSWGKNVYGVLGLSNKNIGEVVSYPTLIDKITYLVKMAAVSDTHSLILTTNGEIYACGSNLYGKLGIGDMNKYFQYMSKDTPDIPFESEPQVVKNTTFADYVACSNNHSACIMKYDSKFASSYRIFTWGSGFMGKLGHFDGGDAYEPKKVEDMDNKSPEPDKKLFFVKLALGDEFTLALDINGYLWGWGKKKYLSSESNDESTFPTPQLLFTELKFKYITSSPSNCMAIDIEENVYLWGKITHGGKTFFQSREKVYCDKMMIAACGLNHFCTVESKLNLPYTWGSNLFFKCGQNFSAEGNAPVNSMEDIFQSNPRKNEFFFDYFMRNLQQIENEKQKLGLNLNDDENKNDKDNNKLQKSNDIQNRLLDEKPEFKNIGLLGEDYKINTRFYEILSEFFKAIKAIESDRLKERMTIENTIISVINEARSLKNTIFKSDVPKIISQNFQLFEAALGMMQIHPCYLQKAYKFYDSKSAFIELVKMVFGRNYVNMRNKRVIFMLMGLWNALFTEETKEENSNSLKTTDKYEDFVTYDLYDLIFKINKENLSILYDTCSEIFLYFIIQLFTIDDKFTTNTQDILSNYKDIPFEIKKEICSGVVKIIADRMEYLFSEMKENLKNNFSFSVVWIFKRISKLFKTSPGKGNQEVSKNELNRLKAEENQFFKVFNYFIFVPFLALLKTIRESYDESKCYEYLMFTRRLPEVLERLKTKPGFSQLYNLYKSDKISVENKFFKKICSSKSEILNQVYQIFQILSKRDFKDSILEGKGDIIDNMNRSCKQSLKDYQYDFTLTSLRELLKTNVENGNESVVVPLSIKDIIELRDCLGKINKNMTSEEAQNDPMRSIIQYINEFKLDDLDNNSNIRNFVLNFYIKPNTFLYNAQLEDPKIIKCFDCQLPIHHVFYSTKTIINFTEWTEWPCERCGMRNNDKNSMQCKNKSCNAPKSKAFIKNSKTFFKLFKIPHDDEETLMFEDVLFNVTNLNENVDVISELNNELTKLRSVKGQDNDKFKIELFQKFINIVNSKVGNSDDSQKAEILKKERIKMLMGRVEQNYKSRTRHLTYLSSINEFINFLLSSAETAKANFTNYQRQNEYFMFNLKRGFSNDWAKNTGILTKVLKSKVKDIKDASDKNTIKKFLAVKLISAKVIDEILFQNQPQPKLTTNSYLLFEKHEKGYTVKLIYKEIYRKYILCGVNTHEYILEEHNLPSEAILEMRRNAKHNPTLNLGDIRFNIFYLIKLLNSMETLN